MSQQLLGTIVSGRSRTPLVLMLLGWMGVLIQWPLSMLPRWYTFAQSMLSRTCLKLSFWQLGSILRRAFKFTNCISSYDAANFRVFDPRVQCVLIVRISSCRSGVVMHTTCQSDTSEFKLRTNQQLHCIESPRGAASRYQQQQDTTCITRIDSFMALRRHEEHDQISPTHLHMALDLYHQHHVLSPSLRDIQSSEHCEFKDDEGTIKVKMVDGERLQVSEGRWGGEKAWNENGGDYDMRKCGLYVYSVQYS
ncbi:hypothetical protein DEU56DRAFT_761972 [Suillus clintonianus]|uniref:uncharacterized protein n=1 Tax=Suillus clintonianus TaxID=1904413 RepID=UPI001B86A4DF|nr:uncharacterized protein DEU56DRAFT_761972 [Suillus clintonianus]KAG2112877.1 hypothetical protein DEU56DRAFT_761972 [Suillus clintonianus]